MDINIFLLCYNEELMLPYTLKHYKTRFPSAVITIFDNHSTDRSVEIAEKAGCRVVTYDSNGQQDEQHLIWVRSHMWKKYVQYGWVIMCDMDEWLDITEAELVEEDKKGTTILMTQGFNMIGESIMSDYSDIDLFKIKRGVYADHMSKRICFKYPVLSVEYWYGAHKCFPQGYVAYSTKTYLLKHYDMLGQAYLVEKHRRRYERNILSRVKGLNQHYLNDREKTIGVYQEAFSRSVML
jgi:glycosyltransferase involved in cell wall biosynthesis